MFRRVIAQLKTRKAKIERSRALAAYREAQNRGDCRAMHETHARLSRTTNALLRLEVSR